MPVSVSATTTVKEPPPPPTPSSGGGTSQYTTPKPEESIKNTVSPVTVPPKPQNSPPVAAIGGVQVTSRQEKNSLSELSENMLGGVDNFNTGRVRIIEGRKLSYNVKTKIANWGEDFIFKMGIEYRIAMGIINDLMKSGHNGL